MAQGQATQLKTETQTVRDGQRVVVTQEGNKETVETREDVAQRLRESTLKELLGHGEHKG